MNEVTAVQLIPPLNESAMVQGLERLYLKKKISKVPPDDKWNGADVYEFGDGGTGYVCLVKNDVIVYFVRYRKVRGGGNKFGRQVLVWKNKNVPATAGFASHVFFEKLLPKFGALITDTQQTEDGKAFWGYCLMKAFLDPALFVYFYSRRETPNRLVQLHNHADLDKFEADLWGHSDVFILTHLVISQKGLKLRNDTNDNSK
jgi:hypothetical protein